MRITKPALLLAVSFILLIGPVVAREPLLVSAAQFDPNTILHAPPAEASTQTQTERAELRQIEAHRTQADFDKAVADEKEKTVFLFRTVFGDGFTAEHLPLTAAFFATADDNDATFVEVAKQHWQRQRPFAVDADLHPCSRGAGFSYPSGHATRAYTLGILLGSVIPEKRDAILDRAADYAHGRLVCVEHHRSDVEAGRQLGTALAAVMLSLPQVQHDLQAVRTELVSAGYTSP
jgi:acid phosphatase (class A)